MWSASKRSHRSKYHFDGAPENYQVAGQRPVLDVVEIEPDTLFPAQIRSAVDLPHAGEARLDIQAAMNVPGVLLNFTRQGRPRPDQAHVANKDVEKLRQLIQRVLSQHPA